jgi:divalent metal cation (Fe/Co/Zn/Cd) transporter
MGAVLCAESENLPDASLRPVIGYLKRCIGYEVFIVVLSTGVVYSSGSRTAIFPFLFAVGGGLCLWLMLYTMKAAARGDVDRYPYGTGRLENVCAILLAMMFAVGTMVPLVKVMSGLIKGEVDPIRMGGTFALLFITSVGNVWQVSGANRLRKINSNPILESLSHLYHAGAVRDCGLTVVIGLCWLIKGESLVFMSRVDSFATIILAIYSLYHFLPQIWVNFRALADFPLSEEAQLKVMGILARHFDAYEMPGKIYTTNRGSTHVFEVELAFKPEMNVGELVALEQQMREDFQAEFPDCVFRIIPQEFS